MTDRQKSILAIAEKNPVLASVVEYAEFIAEETLADQIWVNGVLIYQS